MPGLQETLLRLPELRGIRIGRGDLPALRERDRREAAGAGALCKSEENRLDALADPSQLAGIEDDPKAMARLMKQMSSELGEDPGPEFNEVVDRLEKGQSPEQIERDLPDFGDGGFGDE